MKTRILIIASIAALTLGSGAHAATGNNLPHHNNIKGGTWWVDQQSDGKITIGIGPQTIYTYHPAPAQPQVSSSIDTSDDCVDYQLNCTDEQNCHYFGFNCSLTQATASNAQAAAQDQPTNDAAPAQPDTPSTAAEPDAPAATDTAPTAPSTTLADQSQNIEEDC